MGSRKTFIPLTSDLEKLLHRRTLPFDMFKHAGYTERHHATADRSQEQALGCPAYGWGRKKREAGIVVGHQTQAGKGELQDGHGEGANATQRLPRLIDQTPSFLVAHSCFPLH
jgi:hypothetical protein